MEELQIMWLNNTNPVNVLRTPAEISLLEAQKKNLQHIPNDKLMTSLLCFYRQGRCTTDSLYELVWEEPYLSLVSPSRAAGVYKAAPCCVQCYLLKHVLMPHTHACLFNPVHTFRTSQCVCCKDLHNHRRHELTLHVEQLPLMKWLKWNRNYVGRFHTADAGSRKFEHKYLPLDTKQTGIDNRPLDKAAFRFLLRVCVLSFVSVAWSTFRTYLFMYLTLYNL